MEAFLGEWKLDRSDGFDAIMQRLGVNAFTRKAGNTMTPKLIISTWGEGYCAECVSEFKKTGLDFKLSEPYVEMMPGGRRVKSASALGGNVMNQVQFGEKTAPVDRFINDGMLKMVSVISPALSSSKEVRQSCCFIRYLYFDRDGTSSMPKNLS
ncbi:unnamed protein product [Schistocephalus solidus]|uniref:Lipocln_cytosolic_FA-bd_dom domain-containing protein n=1 Tax=Schistocephalus solidus TaxID=70667 RepID=A0A183TCA5_SCHSO|nr:unnamed protein product [Schistocephalus solidus]